MSEFIELWNDRPIDSPFKNDKELAEEENRSFSNMVVCILEQWRDSKKQKSA